MATIELHPLMARLIDLEAQVRDIDERQEAIELVMAWLLAQQPEALRFLSAQANELDRPESRQKFAATIDLLDELRDAVRTWHDLQKTPP